VTRDRVAAILTEAGLPPDPDTIAGLPDVDLGELAERGIQPPELLCGGMLYAGMVHCLAGEPGGGKTTLAAWLMLTHIRDGGRAMLLDEESGEDLILERLLDMGFTPDELRPPVFSYVPFPGRGWNLADIAQLHDRLAERKPGIVAWDSTAEFLSIADRDENSATDVTAFWKRVLKPCAREYGAAVLAIDHTGKGAEHGGYGRGSGAKKAASDVQFMVETVRPFSRQQDGLLRLTTKPGKDRRGRLPLRVDIHVRAGTVLTLEAAEAAAELPGARDMSPGKAKLLEALGAIGGGLPVTSTQLVDWIAARHGHGLKRQTVSTYLNELEREGLADSLEQGTGKPKLWTATRRDEAEDGW